MCFSQPDPPPPAPPPAAAPPPPQPVAENVDPSGNRKAEDLKNFGTSTPSLRREDRSVTGGGATSGGTGIRSM